MKENNISINKNFNPITPEEIIKILDLTVKKDNHNKLATFLCCLSAYTNDSQFNISFNAPSSAGKSYIPLEISNYFPKEDLLILGSCSPTSFFHEQGEYNQKTNTTIINLSRKIIIFLDQPDHYLLEKFRPLLSHDKKELINKITDRKEKGGHRTKTAIIIGYPSVIFCSASIKIDEQESTRFLMLSPDTNQDKLKESIQTKITKEANKEVYENNIQNNPERQTLIDRIEAIKSAKIENIIIEQPDLIEKLFFDSKKKLRPRDQRDIGRFISLVKCYSLLNLWFRKKVGNNIYANEEDINYAHDLWSKISVSQELNISPYLYSIFNEIILPLYKEKISNYPDIRIGISRPEILKRFFQTYQYPLPEYKLRQEILPMLENAGLIVQDYGPDNQQKILIFPNLNL